MEYLYAFLTGGAICVIGQILMDATKLTAPRVLVILVTAGALLQAFHLYEPLVDLAQTGARCRCPGLDIRWQRGLWKELRRIFWKPLPAESRLLRAVSP